MLLSQFFKGSLESGVDFLEMAPGILSLEYLASNPGSLVVIVRALVEQNREPVNCRLELALEPACKCRSELLCLGRTEVGFGQ